MTLSLRPILAAVLTLALAAAGALALPSATALAAPRSAAPGGTAASGTHSPSPAMPHFMRSHVAVLQGSRSSRGGPCVWHTRMRRRAGGPPIAVFALSVNVRTCRERVRIGNVAPPRLSAAGRPAPLLPRFGSGAKAGHASGRKGLAPTDSYCINGGYDEITWYDPVGLVMNDTTAQNSAACFDSTYGYADYCSGYYTWAYGIDGWYISGGPSYNTVASGNECYNSIFINYENDIFCALDSTYVDVPDLEYNITADGWENYYYSTYAYGACSGLLNYAFYLY